jgi:hypothetical protein
MSESEQKALNTVKDCYPWTVYDAATRREYVRPQPLLYFVVKGNDGRWFVCDRSMDIPTHGTFATTREGAIRLFYERNGRPMPKGTKLYRPEGVVIRDQD